MTASDVLPLVWVVDDEPLVLGALTRTLSKEFCVVGFSSGQAVLERPGLEQVDLMLSDIRMPGVGGADLLSILGQREPDLAIVLITGHGSVPDAVEAIRRGAYDYLLKPVQPETLLAVTRRAVERTRLARRTRKLESKLLEFRSHDELTGCSGALKAVLELVARVQGSDVTVLIEGESGTGKERLARLLHRSSRRSSRPFVAVNCGAIPRELMESELFGYARGSFTGARDDHAGLVASAGGGTLFLDEIAEVPAELQVKLNRFLQEREIRPVGSVKTTIADVRVIAATHRDLGGMVADGLFREDLFYRLHVYPIRMPPLRERMEDISSLAHELLARSAASEGRQFDGFSAAALDLLCRHDWPGNVRELESVVTRAVLLAPGPRIEPAHLPTKLAKLGSALRTATGQAGQTYAEALGEVQNQASVEYLTGLLRRHGGNVSRACEEAGLSREALHRLLRRYNVQARDFRRRDGGGFRSPALRAPCESRRRR